MTKSRVFVLKQLRASIFGSLLLAGLPAAAANYTWKGNNGNWNDASQWVEGLPLSNFATDLLFLGSGTLSYTSTNNFASPFTLNSITLNSTSTGASTIAGTALEFVTDTGSATSPRITQSGSGAFAIMAPLNANEPLALGGAGTGLVTLGGNIGGAGGLAFSGANWRITDATNSFSGVMAINAGVTVELAAAGAAPQGVALGSGIGMTGSSTITLDGGALKLTTNGSATTTGGASLSFGGREITFGTNGGTLDLRNSNSAAVGVHAGSIGYNSGTAIVGGGDLRIALNNDLTHPAVIQFNGGQLGLSEITTANATNGNWSLGGNMLRFASLGGTGPLRIELTNGAAHLVTGGYGSNVTIPITVRGVVGGDPTSGLSGTVNTGITLNAGRMMFDNQRVTYAGGITIEGAMQIVPANRATAMNGNITVASNGYVAFQGRGTGTALSDSLNLPGNGAAGHNVLWVGEDASTTLTIQNGGIAAFDGRLRTEQANAHGVLLGGNAVVNAGGTLRIQQSISNFSALGGLTTNQNEGDIILRGTITGEGSSTNESVLDIKLPAPDINGSAATGVPTPLTAAAPAAGTRPFAGLVAEPTNTLIVNGTGFGGLRISATARPDRLFSATGAAGGAAIPDPTSNLTKLSAYLTAERLAAVSGTGGYLTVAPTGATFAFPAGSVWADPDIGLRVIDSNSAGPDVSLAALNSWNKNLAVDAAASLDLGGAAFSFTGPTLHGKGIVTSTGTITIANGSSLSPGLGDIGTLTLNGGVTINGSVLSSVSSTTGDLLVIGGNLTLGGTITLAGTFGINDITIATYSGTLTGSFSSIVGLPANFAINYGTRSNSAIRLVFTTPTRVWNGNVSGVWNTSAANWQGGTPFSQTEKVVFDDTAAGPNLVVTVAGADVQPASVRVNNVTKAYSIVSSSGAAIVGTTPLIKDGTGLLTLSGPAAYSGGTQLNAGELRLGSNNSLPDTGAVTVAAGATLNIQANSDTVEAITVTGSVTGTGTLTLGALNLGSGATFTPNLVLNGDVTKTGANATTITGSVNLGGSTRTFTVDPSTAPELTISGAVTNGGITKAGTGTLVLANAANSFSGPTTITGGTLKRAVAGALPALVGLTVGPTASLDTTNLPLSLSSLSGSGTILMGNGSLTINQTTNSTFSGAIDGSSTQVIKQGTGMLTLTGASTYDGGLLIQAGRVAASGTGVGIAGVTVNAGAGLQLVGNLTGPVTVNSGTVSVAVDTTNGIGSDFNITGNSTIHLYDENAPANTGDFIVQGTLRGSGNLDVSASSSVGGADGADGFRLRGTGLSDYSGTILVGQRTKFELQSGPAGDFSPMGTGKIILTAGTVTGGLNGTYAQFQTRVSSGGATTNFNNNVEITGSGIANFNVIGGANTTAVMGNLKIGAGQSMFFNKNDNAIRTVVFPTVTLTAGDATFSVWDPSFGSTSGTAIDSVGPNVQLGIIGESQAGAGITVRSSAAANAVALPQPHVTVTGVSTYTGPTTIQAGILSVGATGSIQTSSEIRLSESTSKLDVTEVASGYPIAPAQKITGIGDWDGRIVLNGTLAPGSGIGALTGDDLTINGPGVMQFELSGVDSSSDRLTLSGAFEKGAAGSFRFDFANGGANGRTYTLVQFLSTTFAVSDFTWSNLAPGLGGSFRLTPTELQFVVIPEPNAFCAFAGGIGFLVSLRRFRRHTEDLNTGDPDDGERIR